MKSLTKRFLALMLAAGLVVGMFPTVAAAADATQIQSLSEITDMAGSYVLTGNTTATEPVGSESEPFTGTFDGGGHTVTLELAGEAYMGMFAYLGTGATVSNLKIDHSTVTGTGDYTGLVAGYNKGVISNVVVTNSTVNGFEYAGGIAGYSSGTITKCAMESGKVAKANGNSVDEGFGGIVGWNDGGTVSQCSNGATVSDSAGQSASGYGYFGGIVGENAGSNYSKATVEDCYNTGDIVNESGFKGYYCGGIVGKMDSSSYASVTNCHNYGTISIDSTSRYAVAEYASNCYFLTGCVPGSSSNIGQGKSASEAEFASLAEKLGTNWIDGKAGYPVLTWQDWKYSATAVEYTIDHYTEDLAGGGYTLYTSEKRRGEPEETVTAEPIEIEGFTFDEDNEKNERTGNPSADLVLKLYYSRDSYTLTWEPNGGEITSQEEAYTHGKVKFETEIVAPEVHQTGKSAKWSETLTTMPARDVTITATWSDAVYTVHWDANGGAVTPETWSGTSGSTQGVTYGHKYGEYNPGWESYWTRDLPVPTHSTKAFAGWYTDVTDGTLVTKDTTVDSEGDRTLYAHWDEAYTVTFELDGGSMSGGAEKTYHLPRGAKFTDYFDIPTATKSCHSFLGWFDAEHSELTEETLITSDVTFTAEWKPYTYYVAFDANGGTGEMERQLFTYGVAQELRTNTFERPGYRFLGWATWRSATEAAYADGESYNGGTPHVDGAIVQLYAVWEEAFYNLTLNVTPADAKVEVKNGDGGTESAASGNVYRLHPGTYSYTVSKYGYQTKEGSVELNDDTRLDIELEKIPAYKVTFAVTKPDGTGEAEITVTTEDGEEVAAEPDGAYELIPGKYSYAVCATGCNEVKAEFTVEAQALEIPVTLEPRTAWDGETKAQPATVTAEQAAEGGIYEGKADWYIITNGDELAWLADYVNENASFSGNALLANDIDLGGENWTPMGTGGYGGSSYTYGGIFDGMGHTIRGLAYNGEGDNVALFGYITNNAVIRNVTVEGEITNTDDSTYNNTAGLVACMNYSDYQDGAAPVIENCGSYVNVNGNGRVGGLVAYLNGGGSILRSFNAGTVRGGLYLSGIAAYAYCGSSSSISLTDDYNNGELVGSETVSGSTYTFPSMGGIVGYLSGTLNVTNCYNAGSFTKTDRYTYASAILGQRSGSGAVTYANDYYLDTTADTVDGGSSSESGITSVSSAALSADDMPKKLSENFKLDGKDVRQINDGYPILVWQKLPEESHVHTWGEPEFNWSADGKSCEVVFTCTEDPEHTQSLSAEITSTEKMPATCTENGTTTYTAKVNFEGHEYTNSIDLNDIPATGHSWGAPVFTWSEDGTKCSVTFTCEKDAKHVETVDATVTSVVTKAPTCTDAGVITYTATVRMNDQDYSEEKTVDVPAKGHTWGAPVFAWSEDGKTCTVTFTCTTDRAHTATPEVTVTSAVKTPPTCQVPGTTEYTATVTLDGKPYTDTRDVVDIPATGHSWGEPVFTWSEDGKTCLVSFVCANGHTATIVASVTAAVKTPATCEEAGTTVYTATVTLENTQYTDTRELRNIPATGHNWNSPVFTWSLDGKTCATHFICGNDASHTADLEATVTSAVKTQATCEEAGVTTYAAAVTLNGKTYTAARELHDIPATGHSWGEPTFNWSADGKSCKVLLRCANDGSHLKQVEATVTGKVTTPATQTAPGTTTYTASVTVDGKTYTDAKALQDVPATGHVCDSKQFSDLSATAWYHDGVDFMLANGYMSGISDTVFEPGTPITRGMLVTLLYRIAGKPSVEGLKMPFTDVESGRYYTGAILWAYHANVVAGMDGATYAPEEAITREQLVSILYRYDGATAGKSANFEAFPDHSSVSHYAQDAMNWAVQEGLVSGVLVDGTAYLQPQGTASRAQAANILMRYLTNE